MRACNIIRKWKVGSLPPPPPLPLAGMHVMYHTQSSFVDKVRIYARGGTGGQGSSKLGSVGGLGGDVLVCSVEGSNLRDISRLATRRFVAGVGGESERSRVSGKKGHGVSISVPPGTVVYDAKETMVTPSSMCLEQC